MRGNIYYDFHFYLQTLDLISSQASGLDDLIKVVVSIGVRLGHIDVLLSLPHK